MPIKTNYTGIYSQSMSNTQRDQERFNAELNVHLDHLNSRSTGNQLLNELQQLSQIRRHKATIHEIARNQNPCAEPVLSRHQLDAHPELTRFKDIREKAGLLYALKKPEEGKNEGSSVVISWSPHQTSIELDEDGDPTGRTTSSPIDKVSVLAHELVHAKHIMAGTWKGSYEDERNPDTPTGKEELRAVGLGKYKYSESGEPSENSIRAEHGLPKRVSYHYSGYRSE
ncbi:MULTISPECIES: type III secretion system effector protein [Xanthomonas]|uniref:Type III secretion system effector protein n=1 Tax=Xanthomonas dyei TaxID=743699 RepID=A0ABZ0DBL9_9XANT|nr:type III secretion system effector protein [Xanthomonas dyei]WOB27579.1 type III secretion system effector protein [Xanthomonas dyei]WOB55201.1 type III secretion system effector protein [Xanthomonas dyei]